MSAPVISNRDPKLCTTCGVEKPLSAFYPIRTERGVVPRIPLFQARCKACCIARVQKRVNGPKRVELLAQRQRHYQRLKEEGRANLGYEDRMYHRLYASSRAAYDTQLASQNGRCAVCNRLPAEGEARFAFDHDHVTGLTRGVLCPSCNGGLGCFRDDPVKLRSAITYLLEWAEQHATKESA